jgi:hypothetical protein
LSKEFAGEWEGALDVRGKVQRVVLKLAAGADGAAAATLIAEQRDSTMEIPITTVWIRGKELDMEARAVSGMYRGAIDASGDISGEWSQGAVHLPLQFKRISPDAKR